MDIVETVIVGIIAIIAIFGVIYLVGKAIDSFQDPDPWK